MEGQSYLYCGFDANINHLESQSNTMSHSSEQEVSRVIRSASKIDSDTARGHLDDLVRSNVEDAYCPIPNAGADHLCYLKPYEQTPDLVNSRARGY